MQWAIFFVLGVISFSMSSYFIWKRCRKDREMIRELTSSVVTPIATEVELQTVQGTIIVSEPTVPVLP